MRLQKWNPEKHHYEPFDSPAKKTTLYASDMNLPVDCAECGVEVPFGECLTSRMIHTDMGFGYPVCINCYGRETK